VSRVFIYCAMLVLMASLPFPLFAGGDTSTETEPDAQKAPEAPTIQSPMLRIESPIEGYQALSVAGQEIDATYIEESLGERHGAIVLLHDDGEQLESQGVITPLRHQLPPLGWSTLTLALDYPFTPNVFLSIKTDDLATDASSAEPAAETEPAEESSEEEKTAPAEPEANNAQTDESEQAPLPPISNQQRVEAGLAFLKAKDVKRIIFIGHGAGGHIAIKLLDKTTTPVSALVLIGAGQLDTETEAIFKAFKFPVLDVVGDKDFNGVLKAANHRKVLMKREGNTFYQKRELPGADHFFTGLNTTLTALVHGWLKKRFVEKDDE